MGKNMPETPDKKVKKIEAMVFGCITLAPEEKADIIAILPKLDDKKLTEFETIFENDRKRTADLFRKALELDPNFGKKFKKNLADKMRAFSKALETEEAKEARAEEILRQL
jgi:transcription initiation factor TFIIIB Brf1 subunit/transcription initiation factor TFIIB